MAMCGCEFWDFSSKETESFFYVAWRKSVQLLWSLPYSIPILIYYHSFCDDLSGENQMHKRFLKSIRSNMITDNGLVKLCARLCLEGSISDTSW